MKNLYFSLKSYFLLGVFVLFAGLGFSQTRIYVDASAAGANNGSSWTDAFTDLQDAFDASSPSATDEIWVAAGTYYPTRDTNGVSSPPNARTRFFYIKKDVAVYGGFVGTETSLNQTNPKNNETILSGDYGTLNDSTDNAYHTVFTRGLSSVSIISGFTITEANADNSPYFRLGGGMMNDNSSPTIKNCVFKNNTAHYGGGIFNSSSSSRIENCVFTSNIGIQQGGGALNFNASAFFYNCVFYNNTSLGINDFPYGGGMMDYGTGTTTLINCTFYDNTASLAGGGLYQVGSPTKAILQNCIFWNNTGGDVQHNSIPENISSSYSSYTSVSIGGTGDITGDPLFTNEADPNGADNIWATSDDGLQIQNTSPCNNTGDTTGTTSEDILGTPKKANGTFDMGAYQFFCTNPPTSLSIPAGDNEICEGQIVALDADEDPAYTYIWFRNGEVIPGETNSSYIVDTSGSYTVDITDANNGCNGESSPLSIIHHELPPVYAGEDFSICEYDSVLLQGSGAETYFWSNGVTDGKKFIQNPGTVNYTLVGIDNHGCSNADFVSVMSITKPNAPDFTGNITSYCHFASTQQLMPNNTVTVWFDSVKTLLSPSPNPSSSDVGNHSYFAIDTTNGCVSDTAELVINIRPLPEIDAGDPVFVCDGDPITLSGSGGVSYVWTTGYADGESFVPPHDTMYYVTGTDATGCQNTDSVEVEVGVLPTINAGNDIAVCEEGYATLKATGAVTYEWSDGVQNSIPIQVFEDKTYSVTGYDEKGCMGSDEAHVFVKPKPIVDAGNDTAICYNAEITLEATGTGSTYTWNNDVQDGVSFQTTETKKYKVIARSPNNCFSHDFITVTVWPNTIKAEKDKAICFGDSVVLIGSGGANYVWNDGVINNTSFYPAETKTYTVSGEGPMGCINSDEVTVVVHSLPEPTVSTNDTIEYCFPLEIPITSNEEYAKYQWLKNDVILDDAKERTVFVLDTGVFTVSVEDENGCGNAISPKIVVLEKQKQTMEIAPTPAFGVVCSNDGEKLSAIVNDNDTLGVYSWYRDSVLVDDSGEFFIEVVSPESSGNYFATAIDTGGCLIASNKIELNMIQAPSIPEIVKVGDSTLAIKGGFNGNVLWTLDDFPLLVFPNDTITVEQEGVYEVNVFGDFICSETSEPFNFKFVSITERGKAKDFQVYPNPFSDEIQLSGVRSGVQITITDIVGKVVMETTLSVEKRIDLSHLKKGVFLLHILDQGESELVKRIVKE